MNRNQVKAEVSQHSRDSGRKPVGHEIERDEARRIELVRQLKEIEGKLMLIEADKRDATLMSLRRNGTNRARNIEDTMEIEATNRRSRAALIREKAAIDEELADLKRRRRVTSNTVQHTVRDDVVILMRIEDLLTRIANKLGA